MPRASLLCLLAAMLGSVLAGCGLGRSDLTQTSPYGPSHSRAVPILLDEQPSVPYRVLATYRDPRPRERPGRLGLEGVAQDIGADAILARQSYSHTERKKNVFGGGVATTHTSGPQGSTTTTETVPEYTDVRCYRFTYQFVSTATTEGQP